MSPGLHHWKCGFANNNLLPPVGICDPCVFTNTPTNHSHAQPRSISKHIDRSAVEHKRSQKCTPSQEFSEKFSLKRIYVK